jgi:transcriptional regulator with XRE-family HTH domain
MKSNTSEVRGKGIFLPELRTVRQEAGLSVRALEQRTKEDGGRIVYRSTISDLELLQRGSYPRTAARLAEVLGVSVAVLKGTD